jgi:NAD+ synthase (glutamine-hydrolysing)
MKWSNKNLRIGMAQVNPIVGDLAGNTQLILQSIDEARRQGAEVVLFPELVLTGYPPEDLLLKPSFIADNQIALATLAKKITGIAAVVGFVDSKGSQRFNAAAWVENGRVRAVYRKILLPNYGVFDEKRYFEAGNQAVTVPFKGLKIGLSICEDLWIPQDGLNLLKKKKPDVVFNLSSSPFHAGKITTRHTIVSAAARYLNAPVLYCNLVGGQDELIFDGGSLAATARGTIAAQIPQFATGVFTVELKKSKSTFEILASGKPAPKLDPVDEIYRALVLGLRDYVIKNGFKKVALGISGGIDSALVAALAVEALGKSAVIGVTLPSRFNLSETKNDARRLAENLGIEFHELPIQNVFENFLSTLSPVFKNTTSGLAEENLQARIRGSLLMAMSNKFGWLILTTGNKSEMSTGYCTLYGDTAGGFAILKDVLKKSVYDLSRFVNKKAGQEIIPTSIIDRPPTAELRDNQRDEDSLGAYADLDPIIVDYVEKNEPLAVIQKKNPGKEAYVTRILSLIDRSEYKRRQAPPGLKITPRSFGRDHRMPITNRYIPKPN